MERQDPGEEGLQRYLDLPTQMIRTYLLAILARPLPEPGRRQEAFNPVETLLCYGLFELLNPHRYGGGNIDQGYIAVGDFYGVLRSGILQESIMKDQGVRPYFADLLSENLLLPANAQRPLSHYLEYHLQHIFRVDVPI